MAENIQSDKVMMGESGASNSNATSQAQTTEPNITKKRRKRFVVWDHFTEIITSKGSTKAKCDYCFIEYVFKTKDARFPILEEMARDVLAVPVSSVASECAFSTGGRLLDSFRSSLTPKLVQALVCLQDWLRNEKLKQPISIEEDLDKIEQLEQDLASNGKDSSVIDV
ncbi:zinc finger BED domain-containing protein RICESLEEPER 4-like isoform X1 [Nicotiana tabacum]|uniref:Zinc finger BED domain-containing protein RICESLEEPER 4-like isoform X1 n=2 Tax=Nicotiana TaxID=4085 RepID=A0AC58S1Y1_TOBAC|nr:PREDICTED: zinc finger BED domain-containing protein RICESLEEPER 4-like [Nicotiana sylvestris]